MLLFCSVLEPRIRMWLRLKATQREIFRKNLKFGVCDRTAYKRKEGQIYKKNIYFAYLGKI